MILREIKNIPQQAVHSRPPKKHDNDNEDDASPVLLLEAKAAPMPTNPEGPTPVKPTPEASAPAELVSDGIPFEFLAPNYRSRRGTSRWRYPSYPAKTTTRRRIAKHCSW
jgi:hypothetical protein